MEPPGHFGIVEHSFHARLRIVEAAIDGDIVDVGREHGGHLAPLDIADPAIRVEHEDIDPIASCDGIDRRRTGIAAGRTDNSQVIAAARKERLEQQAEQLQRHVLESQRWAVEQFEQPMLFVELLERGHGGVRELAIGALAQAAQFVFGQAAFDKGQHHPRGKLGIGQSAHCRDLFGRELGPCRGHIEPPIRSQPGERSAFEIERRGAAASGNVFHRVRRLALARLLSKRVRLCPAQSSLRRRRRARM